MPERSEVIAIVGAGPVGALQACILADNGYHVNLYEMRDDIRKSSKIFGRSINLSLSVRGRSALQMIGIEEEVKKQGSEIYGRKVHKLNGEIKYMPYGRPDEHILSIGRRKLNEMLLSAAESRERVSVKFQHKLRTCDVDKKKLIFKKGTDESVEEGFDVVMGCDGAFSTLRTQIMKSTMFDFSQEFIPDGYMELRIPPTEDKQFALDKNCLHIWPRGRFMMIALPNAEDKSFVMTLFMPMQMFNDLDSDLKVIDFFKVNFEDALELITKEALVETFQKLTPLPMVSIKCSPYNLTTTGVLFGDSAHAMVPFYGQGLNCGLEDLKVFDELMTLHNHNFDKVLPEFSKLRVIDAQTMNDLAMYNYHEMRDHVNSKWFMARKMLDGLLNRMFPHTWIPLYTMVAFSRMRYHKCMEKKKWQDDMIRKVGRVLGVVVVGGMTYAAFKNGLMNSMQSQCCLLYHNFILKLS